MSKEITTKADALKECPKPRIEITNIDTGETIDLPCKSWNCEFCRPIKKRTLTAYIIDQLVNIYDEISIFTFSLRAGVLNPTGEPIIDWHGYWSFLYKTTQEIYRRFITELRRGTFNEVRKKKTDDKTDMHTIRLNEVMKTGQGHMHVLVDEFIKQEEMYARWNQIAESVLCKIYYEKGWSTECLYNLKSYGTVNTKFICNNKWFEKPKDKLRMIAKYVTKQLEKDLERIEQKIEAKENVAGYVTKQVANITSNAETLAKAVETINKNGASELIKDNINNIEEYAQAEKIDIRPFKRYWSKSNNLRRMKDKSKKLREPLLITNLKTGVQTVNLYSNFPYLCSN